MLTPNDRSTALTDNELTLLSRVIRDISRGARLSPDDALDFAQTVHLKLLERGYEPIRQFANRSSLRTFLAVVVRRILIDWHRAQFGKWRSSARARRLGPAALALERLLYRSGHTLGEAIQTLQTHPGAAAAADLERLAEQLPIRLSFRTVSIDAVGLTRGADFEDPIERADHRRESRMLRRRLSAALERLPSDDRTLLDLRYRQRLKMPAIATALDVDSKSLYRRCEKVLRSLRTSLEAQGVERPRHEVR
jgi:RNA polymerase sigma factor for flagellar operon FliA